MLQGRKSHSLNFLVSWTFEGLRIDGKWDLLHSCTNCTFKNSEIRNYPIKTKRGYSAFNITMTDKDSSGEYALCLGQIEVYGMIGNGKYLKSCYCKSSRHAYIFMLSLTIVE